MTNIFDSTKQKIADLQENIQLIEALVEQKQAAVMELGRQFDIAGGTFDADTQLQAFEAFMKKPYILRPIKADRYELIVPRFVGLSAGWPVRQDGEFNVYHVSRFIDLITPVPDWLRGDLDWEPPKFGAHIEGDWLVVDKGDPVEIWRELGGGKKFSGRDGKRLRMIQRQRFQVIRDLIRQGILPYTPQPISKELLRPATGKVELRAEQLRDFQTFVEYGAVSVFATGGAGKTFFGMYAADCIRGPKLILTPRRLIGAQWEERLRLYAPGALGETEIRTYQSLKTKPLNKKYSLIIYDEIQHMPADMGIRAASAEAAARIGLSATPWREDGNEDIIPALCGVPVGMDWPSGETAETTLWIVDTEADKFNMVETLLQKPTAGKTMIFVYRIDVGERIARLLGIPFIHGGTSHQYEAMQKAYTFVVSKIGDAGVSLNTTRVIELDWLGGRAEAGQRALRTRHATDKSELHLLMTRGEYHKQSGRLAALAALHFDVKVMGA